MSRRANPLSVDLPRPEADRPAWGKVGLIAAAGFAIGILWPRLTHTRIAPNPPNDNGSPAAVDPAPARSAAASGSSTASAALSPPMQPPSASAATPALTVGPGIILHCRDNGDAPDESCGALEFDPIAVPRIKALAQCPAAESAAGKLSIGFDVDFRKKTVKVLLGKSTTLPRDKGEALVRCADKAFDKVSLAEVPHEHRRYTLFYTATFAQSAASPSAVAAPATTASEGRAAGSTVSESPASGFATVGWDVAIVRDAPKSGGIVTRVLRGSKVTVIAHQGDWYKVQYGNAEGWVYRGTIGL